MKYDIESIKRRKEINNRIKKIIFIFLIIILYNIVLLYISYIDKFDTPNFYIYKAYLISTDSMKPELNIDDVIIIKRIEESDLKVGDIVTFKKNGKVITHRIIKISNEDDITTYITKGDNNNIADEEKLTIEDIEGKEIIKIPKLGKAVGLFKNGIVIILVILIFLIMHLNIIEMKEKSEIRRGKKKIEDEKFIGTIQKKNE